LATAKKNIISDNLLFKVPVEISYLLLDKKTGIHVIVGFSTLLLDTNKIALQSSETNLPLGQAINLDNKFYNKSWAWI
jgi:hypothetical protein